MPAIATSNSKVKGTGIITATSNVMAGGFMAAKVGDLVGPHPATPFGVGTHSGATIVHGSSVVKINGIPVAREGDLCSCGHTIDIGTGDPVVQVPV